MCCCWCIKDWQSFLRDDTNIGNTRPLIRNTDPVDLLSDSEEDEVASPGIERSKTALVQQSKFKKSLVGNPTQHHEIRAEPLFDKAARSTTSSRERRESRDAEVERPHKRIRSDDERPLPSTSKAQPKTSKPYGRFAIGPRRPVFEQQGLNSIKSRIPSQLGSRTSGPGPAGWVDNPPRAIPIRSPSVASIDRGSPSMQTSRPNQLTAEVRRDTMPASRTNPVLPQADGSLQTREPEKRHLQSVAQEAPARRSIGETRASGSTIKQALLPDLETTPRKRNLRTKTQQQTATLSMKNQWQTKYKDHPFLRQLELMKIPIDMTNEVDTEPPPDNFRFIPENRFSEGTMKPDVDALYGCSCTNCTASCSCVAERNVVLQPNGQSWGLPYKLPKKKLAKPYLLSDLAIHECNIKCSCPPECRNRNVQSGGNVSLQIFKTEHRGWGLRSHDVIAEGEFVDTYRGEILTEREAQRRGRDESRKNVYFFNLDKFSDEIPAGERGYVIDGELMGSPARFINHSCDPNLKVFAVSLIRGNPRVYKLAFFAIRDIAPLEELTFDYQAGLDSGDTTSQNENKNSTRCLCEAENCRDRFWWSSWDWASRLLSSKD